MNAPADPIEHGTPRGFYQHRKRNDPLCQPCRTAYNADRREKRQRAQGATPSQQVWNKGRVGEPVEAERMPTGRTCPVAGCGSLATEPRPAARMVRVVWPDSREPGRWYCPGPCRAYGLALAEVRAIGDSRG
ncbi:hypothetical protein ACFVDH_22070 [Streptomyces sp. NPDC057674]|uniref:hypothetical protein n=1 Tax=Streptomyces sp. NPDC057674 TaxID=3346203 RepID=UPI00367C46A2